MKTILCLVGAISVATACGHVPDRIGVLVNDARVVKSRTSAGVGKDAADSQHDPPSTVELNIGGSTRTFVIEQRDGSKPARLRELPRGEGLEILDSTGHLLRTLRPPEYLTDFATVRSNGDSGELLVLFGYPNTENGGTFRVWDATFREVASWDEYPPPGGFSAGEWQGSPVLFYLQRDTLVIRSAIGRLIERRRIPGAEIFRCVVVKGLDARRTVLLATGSGYTPFYAVCVYDGDRLVFHEVLHGRARDLISARADASFIVKTDEGSWEYKVS